MKNNHFTFSYGSQKNYKERIVSLDTEWAKNWKAEEKFIPFCMAIHSIYFDKDNISKNKEIKLEDFFMETELYFRDLSETSTCFVKKVDEILAKYITDETTFIGHQLSSDLHSLSSSSDCELVNVNLIKNALKNRKKKKISSEKKFTAGDTRYDIISRIRGKEKLRDVSLRLNIFAIQTELDQMSLTKMYNSYLVDNDIKKAEKLLIMNWRHAFQTALVWIKDNVFSENPFINTKFDERFVTTNEIIQDMGKNEIAYLNSDEYKLTLEYKNILKYIEKYDPNNYFITKIKG